MANLDESARWLGKRGDCYVFCRGELRYRRRKIGGKYSIVLRGVTLIQAEQYVSGKTGYLRIGGMAAYSATIPKNSAPKKTKRNFRVRGSRRVDLAANPNPDLTPEQKTERDARIEANRERVEMEMQRIRNNTGK